MIVLAIDLLAFGVLGALLGALYFGGLWLTIRQLPRLNNPMLWLLASTLTRLALVLAAFYLVTRGDWARLLACVAGFIAMRIYMVHKTRSAMRNQPGSP